MSSESPPITKDMLVFVSRLSVAEKASLFTSVFQRPDLSHVFKTAVHEVALQRLIRAEACFKLAHTFLNSSDEESLRTAIGRAYYSIHHSIRAMVLCVKEYDPDGHQECIEALSELLKDNAFLGRSGLKAGDGQEIFKARDNRVVAEYSPFNQSRYSNRNSKIELSHGSWLDTAKFNVDISQRVLVASMRVVGVT